MGNVGNRSVASSVEPTRTVVIATEISSSTATYNYEVSQDVFVNEIR
jgi:hypothetical protein